MKYNLPIKVFDFFSGCGGASKGFQTAGMDIVFALDNDPAAGETFEASFPDAHFLLADIGKFFIKSLQPFVRDCKGHPILFCGCAPCQPFTKQNTHLRLDDGRGMLLDKFRLFVKRYKPHFVFLENVPGLQKVQDKEDPFKDFVETLKKLKYEVRFDVIASMNYGVPQQRRRLILIASRLGPLEFPPETHGPGRSHSGYSTVREWIADLPPINAGETYPAVENHKAANLSEINLKRIQAIPEGGSRKDWPDYLKLECHSNGYSGHTDVYGRMHWDKPASGLTTRCISLSNGRFGHPEQHRAISAREAACLQTFPRDFVFYGSLSAIARQIGNAVPALLAQRFGENFISHLTAYHEGRC